jgi:ACS family tartrate transporter-like MFS transporter
MLLLSLNYLGIGVASLGLLLFLPQIIKQLGVSNMQVGWLTMIPYICGAISLVVVGWLSDRIGERRWFLFGTCLTAAIGLGFAGLTIGTWWALAGISLGTIGLYGTKGPFWSMPTMFITGSAAAAGVAWINSLGNLGGFFGPTIVGWAKQLTGSYAGGLYALALWALLSAVISLVWLNVPGRVSEAQGAAALAE